MSFWDFFKRKEKRAESSEGNVIVSYDSDFFAALVGAGNPITKQKALEIPSVQFCIELLSGLISALPVKLYEEAEDGKVTEIKNDVRVRLLNGDTGDTLNGTMFRRLWVRDYFLGGGAYAYIERDIYGMPAALYYVDESRLSTIPNCKAIFKDYSISVDGMTYPKSDFLKILRNSKGYGKGTSIVAESGTMLATAYNTMLYENSIVKKGGNKKGFFTSQNQQSKESMQNVKSAWKIMNSNSQNAEDNVGVLNAGMDFKEISHSAMDMQLNQNKQTNSGEVCGLFGIMSSMMSGNISAETKENFITNALTPFLNIFETAFDSDMLLEAEKGKRYWAFDTRELTRGDILKRYQAYAIGKKNGFIMINDIREQEDMPPIDFPFIQLNLSDVLYNPETKEIYTPNTDAVVTLKGSGRKLSGDGTSPEDISDSFEELRFNPNHDPTNGRFTSGGGNAFSGLDKSAKGGIIESGSDRVTISAIEQPIEQQHTGKGNPNAILTFDVDLNNRQKELLESLPEYDSRITVPKESVNMADLSALTAKTGDEFAMFTKGNERTVIRGNNIKVNIGIKDAKKFADDGYKWSGHTHPGIDRICLQASSGDMDILGCFNQEFSVIYNSKGDFQTFEKE